MDQSQLPWTNDEYVHSNLFADNQHFNSFEQIFPPDADHQQSYPATWAVDGGDFAQSSQSRAHHSSTPTWMQQQQQQQHHHHHHQQQQPQQPHQQQQQHQQHHQQQLPQPQQHPQQHSAGLPAGSASHLSPPPSLPHTGPSPYSQQAFQHYNPPQQYQYWQQPQYDPSLVAPQSYPLGNYPYHAANYEIPGTSATISPHALQQERHQPALSQASQDRPNFLTHNEQPVVHSKPPPARRSPVVEIPVPRSRTVDQASLAAAIPKGKSAGHFSIIDFDELAKSTQSERMTAFLNVGKEAHEWNLNRAALPAYVPRKSRNELRQLAATDPQILAKLGKKMVRKVMAPPKPPPSAVAQDEERIKYEGDSPSEESSSDEDDNSSYTSGSDSEDSPLPSKRPTGLREAVEYDTIKALWRSKRRSLPSESIRKGVIDFWEIVKTIRDRWKADSTALTEATEKNRHNELALLESRVKDQRDTMESAFKAALKFGHRSIVELLAGNASLVFLCYQFLLDRHKAEDYNGTLPRTLLETMSLFTNLTEEVMERTHLVKVLPRFLKKGDAKTQYYAKRIVANAANATKEKLEEPSKKSASQSTESDSGAAPSKAIKAEPVTGAKRPASSTSDGTAAKRVATGSPKVNSSATAKVNGLAKKASLPTDANKASANAPAAIPKPKQVVAKPSGFFSSLQSATKKPGTSIANKASQPTATTAASKTGDKAASSKTAAPTSTAARPTFSFADTMAALSKPKEEKPTPKVETQVPQETAEQKAKRERKEARRQLHVSFRPGDELVEIRYFTHDPDEESGHDSSQMRDVADVGGEGRMFKQQHQLMDIDDEDELAEDEKLIDFTTPRPVDFSVNDSERDRLYAPYGGGKLQPDSPETAARNAHDADTLIVVYASTSDIPPNPHEPADPYSGKELGSMTNFGAPETSWLARAKAKNALRHGQVPVAAPSTAAPAFDFAKFANYTNPTVQPQPTAAPPMTFPQPPQVPSSDALNNILASLRQNMSNQAASHQQPTIPQYDGSYQGPPHPAPFLQPPQQSHGPPPGQPDLASILATLKQQSAAAGVSSSGHYGGGSFGHNKPSHEDPPREQLHPLWRTKTCIYWQQGKCTKGDSCSFKHEE